jgi:rubrerythrin
MYPAFLAVAQSQGEKGAARTMNWALAAEKVHAAMFAAAKQAVDGGKDYAVGPIQICGNCGFTLEGDAPDKCPVCGVPQNQFKAF